MKKSQKETIVSFDESSERVNVFTHNTDLKKRLTKFAEDYPKLCRLIDDNGHLKNAALLLFGKDPARYFPLCDFRIGRFVADEADLLFQDVIGGDIIRMADRIVEVLKSKYLISPIHYEGLQRIEPLEIPEDALREAIFNAIVHKDYTGVHIQMRVYNDRVELWNSGKLPDELTPEKLRERHSSYPRNKNIAEVFYRAGFIESWERGYEKIANALKAAGLPEAKVEDAEGGVRITIFRKNSVPNGEQVHQSSPKSSPMSPKDIIIAMIQENPKVTIAKMAERLDIGVRAVKKHIAALEDAKVIDRFGPPRTGHWVIIAPVEKEK